MTLKSKTTSKTKTIQKTRQKTNQGPKKKMTGRVKVSFKRFSYTAVVFSVYCIFYTSNVMSQIEMERVKIYAYHVDEFWFKVIFWFSSFLSLFFISSRLSCTSFNLLPLDHISTSIGFMPAL